MAPGPVEFQNSYSLRAGKMKKTNTSSSTTTNFIDLTVEGNKRLKGKMEACNTSSNNNNKTFIDLTAEEDTKKSYKFESNKMKAATSSTDIIDLTGEEIEKFKQFDIVTDHSDHHYKVNPCAKNNDSFTNARSDVQKKIMKEWNILEKNLPENIFVRVYEGRIDLLRAVIIGAPGTPYHDGLFFFDIAFPSDYPKTPPKVYYHSHGLRLNPNLYANGYVCLSILNTWHGSGNELWCPGKSTILQVLVSIQALVLNEKPFYNEPGMTGNSAWKDYNENAFGLSCKTMMFLLRNPPKNFDKFVADHFRDHANLILRSSKAYMEGRQAVGYYKEGSSKSSNVQVSSKFKVSMKRIYNDLVKAFDKNGFANGADHQRDQSEANQNEVSEQKRTGKKRKADCPEAQGSVKQHKYETGSKVMAQSTVKLSKR